MRYLILFRGAPGCGKSTMIKKLGWEHYSIEPDKIRLLIQSPVFDKKGDEIISQNNDGIVWDYVFSILEKRMELGEFTVVDATNSKKTDFKKYKDLADYYRYRIICIDMTNVPKELALQNNLKREKLKIVPEIVIHNMYERFKSQGIPNWVKVIKVDYDENYYERLVEKVNEEIQYKIHDFSHFEEIYVIGDVHGCLEPIQELYKNIDPSDEKRMFIYVGDYIDRGIQNTDTLRTLFYLSSFKNHIFLEGNHEKWLWYWANNEEHKIRSSEFINNTMVELELKNLDKKEVRNFYRKLNQVVFFKYGNNYFLVNHGGVSNIKDNLLLMSTNEFIKGTGKYEDMEETNKAFFENTKSNIYQIHGHRNISGLDTQINERCFNLEGRVEFGGELRYIIISKKGIQTYGIKNNTFNLNFIKEERDKEVEISTFIEALQKDSKIVKKQFGNIWSFNFNRQTYYSNNWDFLSLKSRSLFINVNTKEIVARAYDKFFNINEKPYTKLSNLKDYLSFPIKLYKKENGYLGIIGYDSESDSLIYATKSSLQNEYVDNFKRILFKYLNEEKLNYLKNYLKDNKCSLVCEVVDPINDPHIIEYPEETVIALDLVKNTISQQLFSYGDLSLLCRTLDLPIKEFVIRFYEFKDFIDFYKLTEEESPQIEGYVIKDEEGKLVKFKTPYYNLWKNLRTVLYDVRKGVFRDFSSLEIPFKNKFYNWLISLPPETLEKDIIQLRKLFYKEFKG